MGLIFPTSFFGREEIGLTDRLKTELPGILNWAMAGYVRLRERGHFIQPQNAVERIEQIEILGSPVKAFIRDCCVTGPFKEVGKEVVWSRWREWSREQGNDHVGTKDWFGRNLCSAVPGLQSGKRGPRKGQYRVWEGVGLRPRDEENDNDVPF